MVHWFRTEQQSTQSFWNRYRKNPARAINDRRPSKDWRLAKKHCNDRQYSSIRTQEFPQYFSPTGLLMHQLLHLFHEMYIDIELCILILAALSQVFRFTLALVRVGPRLQLGQLWKYLSTWGNNSDMQAMKIGSKLQNTFPRQHSS